MIKKKTLIKAKELISDPSKWTKGSYARNKDGIGIDPHSKNACIFCMLGAIQKANESMPTDEYTFSPIYEANSLWQKTFSLFQQANSIPSFNDHRSTNHDDVMKAFDLLIEAAPE